ncbi:MAG TPA: hypothetical protein VFH48_24640 [Chloroflexota bacterium]|nr:hypothetical protein [Chloroflexota bacterium]
MSRLVRTRIAAAAVFVGVLASPGMALGQVAPFCRPGESPSFQDGFVALTAELGAIVGEPVECAHPLGPTGDVIQRTTTGYVYWRKITNTPAFTDGRRHWGLTPSGLVYWEGADVDPPGTIIWVGATESGGPVADDPLTAPGALQAVQCPTGRSGGEFVEEGFRIYVTGRCDERHGRAGVIIAPFRNLDFGDGELRFEVRFTSGSERARLHLIVRGEETSLGGSGYWATLDPAAGQVELEVAQSSRVRDARSSTAGQPLMSPDGWNSLVVRAQGPDVSILVNDRPFEFGRLSPPYPESGYVQVFLVRTGDPDDPGETAVVLRNLRVSHQSD